MKKIVLLSILFLSIQSFAQKTITFYNLSSANFYLGEIYTLSTSGSIYPKFKSNYAGGFDVPAGTTYILECSPASTTRFPFLSPSSVPQITSWSRQLTVGGTWTAITSAAVSSAYGNTQVFDFMKTGMGPGSSGSLGSGNLRPTIPSGSPDWTFYTWNSINGIGQGYVTINGDSSGEVTVIITD
ncbi:hypothetical protein [Flavobacterium sp.]